MMNLKPQRVDLRLYNAIYFPIPKVACSSLKLTFGQLLNINYPKEQIHRRIPLVTPYKQSENQQFYKFTFVRNPYDRLVSCFKSKIRKDNITTKWFTNGVNRGIYKMHGDVFWGGMSFKEFAQAVHGIKDEVANEHFRSQYTFLYYKGKCLVDFIGRFEQINEDFQNVVQSSDLPEMELLNYGNSSGLKKGSFMNFYDEETKGVVSDRFKEDFHYFSYEI